MRTQKEDTNKVNTLNVLAWEISRNEPTKAIEYAQQALGISERIKNEKLIADSEHQIAWANYLLGNYPISLEYNFKALKIRESLNNKKGISASLGNIGIVYYSQGDYPKALDYYFKALKMAEELGNKNRITFQLGNIGNIYAEQKDYPKALDYYFKALKMAEELGNKNSISATLGNIGNVYDEEGDSPKALDYYFKALKMDEEMGDKNGIAHNICNIGLLYTSLKKYKEAEYYLLRALTLCDTIGVLDGTMKVENSLSELYSKRGEWKTAMAHYKKYIIARDSITNEENTKKQTRTEMSYEFDKKEAQTKAEQEKKDAVTQAEKKRQQIILILVSCFLLLVVLFAINIFRKNKIIAREKQRSDDLLLNILPAETAEELKLTGHAEPKQFDNVTVLFTDFKEFTAIAEKLSAKELVNELDFLFKKFDEIISKYPIEKIKTIGDSYMCAGGLPTANTTNAMDVTLAALDIQQFILSYNEQQAAHSKPVFQIRIGIHTGPIVAGIVGIKKFAYDIWGDTVNTASRMESSGEAGKVNISENTYAILSHSELVSESLHFTFRGKIPAKNKGEIGMYFVEQIQS